MDNQVKEALGQALDEIAEAHFQACNAIHDFLASVEASVCKAMGATPDEAGKLRMERFAARWAENGRKFDALKAIDDAKEAILGGIAQKWVDKVCSGEDESH